MNTNRPSRIEKYRTMITGLLAIVGSNGTITFNGMPERRQLGILLRFVLVIRLLLLLLLLLLIGRVEQRLVVRLLERSVQRRLGGLLRRGRFLRGAR